MESMIHVQPPPPPLPPMGFESSSSFSPYTGLSFVMSGASSNGGGGGATSGSLHSQPVFVHSRGHPGPTNVSGGTGTGVVGVCGSSDSDCRTTPIDSDLESAKSANLVMSGFPYNYHHHSAYHQHSPHHHALSTGQHRGTVSPSVGSNERHLSIGHAGLISKFSNSTDFVPMIFSREPE